MRKLITLVLVIALVSCAWLSRPTAVLAKAVDGVNLIREVLENIEAYHVDGPDHELLVQGAIWGIIDTLEDPYTSYLTEEELASLLGDIEGQFGGIGIELEGRVGEARVRNVLPGSPAAEAGLAPGDVIAAVDGEDVAGLPPEAVALRIRGPEGTTVRLTILRHGQTFDVVLTRRSIELPSIESELWPGGVAYVHVRTFGSKTARQLKEVLLKYKASGLKGLIIDLRGNQGGLLEPATEVAGYFLGEGRTVAWLKGRDTEEPCRATGSALVKGVPVAVLIDGLTASAAEILAGALRDYRVAFLLGEQTYGKGSVQELIPLNNGGFLRLTTARYSTPLRHPVDGEGLVPDMKIETPALVPLVAEALLRGGAVRVKLTVGSAEAEVNGRRVTLASPPLVIEGVTYVPLRFIAEAFGYQVDWDGDAGAVLAKGGRRIILPVDGKTLVIPDEHNPAALITLHAIRDLGASVRVHGVDIELDGSVGNSINYLQAAG
ncbi:MAG: S41 family peptidase [Desulfotomaculales bacterium]